MNPFVSAFPTFPNIRVAMPRKPASVKSTEEIHQTQERKDEDVHFTVDTSIHCPLFRRKGEISLRPILKLSTGHARRWVMFIGGNVGLFGGKRHYAESNT